ncbi:MAG: type II secretion system protein [Steroidobacteraceae bacterium]
MARRSAKSESPRRARGFTYLGVLFAVAMLGITLAATGSVYSLERQRTREQELLWVGAQYRAAIGRYFRQTSLGLNQYPRTLEELVEDRRDGVVRHHLRRLYADPMTGKADWELQRAPDGAIFGVASRSQARPVKQANFADEDKFLEKAECYCDWKFVFLPVTAKPLSRPMVRPGAGK